MFADVYLTDARDMREVEDKSVDLFIGGSVYIEGEPWPTYEALYEQVYNEEAWRMVKDTGLFVMFETNAYGGGEMLYRHQHSVAMMLRKGWTLIDSRIWQRCKAHHFQPPTTEVFIFKRTEKAQGRATLNKKSKKWFQGVWTDSGGRWNANYHEFPDSLCRMLIDVCTDPGDTVVDCFAGTGTLLKIAASKERRAIGYEMNEDLKQDLLANRCQTHSPDR